MTMRNWNLLRSLVLVSAIATIAVTPALAVAKDYVIGVADVIAVSVLDNRELDAVATVNPGGKIALPLVGEVQASGLTAAELTQRLTDEYAKKVKSPVVTVSLREVNSYRFYFVGKVAKPGMYASRSEVTLLQAISIAGGILDGADLAQAYVARGKDRVPVDFVRLMRQGDLTQNITLNADDTIVLPDNPQHVIYVMGEVKLPGMLPFVKERNWTATKAVAAVGGFTQYAGKGKSYIIREAGGKKLMIPIDFNDLMKNPEAGKDVPLSAGDILVVPQSMF
jgi:polysaccharide export outer membrane protein